MDLDRVDLDIVVPLPVPVPVPVPVFSPLPTLPSPVRVPVPASDPIVLRPTRLLTLVEYFDLEILGTSFLVPNVQQTAALDNAFPSWNGNQKEEYHSFLCRRCR